MQSLLRLINMEMRHKDALFCDWLKPYRVCKNDVPSPVTSGKLAWKIQEEFRVVQGVEALNFSVAPTSSIVLQI